MKSEMLKYSAQYEIIVALVTYLAVCNRPVKKHDKTIDNATAGWLAEHLGFQAQAEEVENVLDGYKSLFRKSNNQYEGRYRYSLLLRYSRRLYKDNQDLDVSEPLPNEELFSLLDFISNKAKMEQEEKIEAVNNRNQLIAMSIAVLSAIVAATASVIAAFVGR